MPPVKLSRERWEMLRGSWEFPIIGMYGNGQRFISVTEPREVSGIVFLPAEYVPADVTWHRLPDPVRVTPADVADAANYSIVHAKNNHPR